MAVPEGYSPLGRLGYVDRGTYAANTKYMKGDVVYYNGSTYTALKDNLTSVTPVNGSNWKYMARGFSADNLSNVQAKDTSGVIGTAGATVVSQALIDAIADKVMTKLLAKTDIVQVESTATNKVPSSAYLKQVKDSIDSNLASKIAVVTYSKAGIPIAAGDDFFANIPVDIDTSAYRWVFPILSDVSGDNSTKINISNCIWQNTQVHIKGNNQAVGAANISLAGVVVAIK